MSLALMLRKSSIMTAVHGANTASLTITSLHLETNRGLSRRPNPSVTLSPTCLVMERWFSAGSRGEEETGGGAQKPTQLKLTGCALPGRKQGCAEQTGFLLCPFNRPVKV